MAGTAESKSSIARAKIAGDLAAPKCLYLAGPTAVGKSAVALALAEKLKGEIITVDSMQVYRGLEIGTAKPLPEERQRARHHLIDVVDLTQSFTAAQFVKLAKAVVPEIQQRQHWPIFSGGTGLYFRAWLEGLGEAPPADPKLRAELEDLPLADLLQELAERDPATFARIDRQNPRRVVRAVEVIRLTGRPFSEQRAAWDDPISAPAPSLFFGLSRNPTDLRQRINQRADAMFARGLVEETQRLLKTGLESNRTATQALGYRQVMEYLHCEHSLDETIELVKTKTWQFAKRQMTWFRNQARLEWIEWEPEQSAEDIASQIIALMKHRNLL